MALQKIELIDKIEIVNSMEGYQIIQVRNKVVVIDSETGEEFSAKNSRYSLNPDADVSKESELVKEIAKTVHTSKAKANYTAHMAKTINENKTPQN